MREGDLAPALAALLRHLAAGPARRDAAAAAPSLRRGDCTVLPVSASLLAEALSHGLIIEEAGEVALTAAGGVALRRHLAGRGLSASVSRGAAMGGRSTEERGRGGVGRSSRGQGGRGSAGTGQGADPHDPSGFGAQHRLLSERPVVEAGATRMVRVNLSESPLAGLARLKDKSGAPFLSEEAVAAGERLHRDFTRGQMQPRLIMAYVPRLETPTAAAAPQAAEISDSAHAARDRVTRAISAIGPELSGIALDICCFEKGLETVERERQWPARSAKLLLRAALMALARHYAPEPRPARQTHAWAAADGRPIRPRA